MLADWGKDRPRQAHERYLKKRNSSGGRLFLIQFDALETFHMTQRFIKYSLGTPMGSKGIPGGLGKISSTNQHNSTIIIINIVCIKMLITVM